MMPDFWTTKNGEVVEIYSADKLSELVKSSVSYYQNEYNKMKEQYLESKEELKKEVLNEYAAENKELKKALKLSYGSFNFPEEKERFENFRRTHSKCWNGTKITSGLDCYIKTDYAGIGRCFIAVCPHCGKEEHITYFEGW